MIKTTFEADVPELGVEGRTIKFPRQIVHPPYKKEKPTSVSSAQMVYAEFRRLYTSIR